MTEIGHGRRPSLEGGAGWHRRCWSSARERRLSVLPSEVVRLRVKRAKALGLDHKTYAGVRAATGHDVVVPLNVQRKRRPSGPPLRSCEGPDQAARPTST